jgi:polar amino acid transport system substrate-binding protein
MSRATRLGLGLLASAAALAVLAGCSAPGSNGEGDGGETVADGKLTIATGEPAYAPWVEDNDPKSGKGLEAAVAYAVADKLGYEKKDVEWVRTPFDAAVAPGPKDWDLNIQQFSVTEDRKKAVDFSAPYYTTTQAVVAPKGGSAADAKSLADLKGKLIGVAAGTTSLDVANELIDPDEKVQVFNSVADAVSALQSDNIDALVTDLPGAYYVRDAQLEGDGVIVGQLDSTKGGDEFAFVLPKDSQLTSKVNAALKKLDDDGTLDKLAEKWLADQDAPVLK